MVADGREDPPKVEDRFGGAKTTDRVGSCPTHTWARAVVPDRAVEERTDVTTRPVRRLRTAALAAAALTALGAAATSASAAVRQSTYTVTRIDQTSTLKAALGANTYDVATTYRYTARLRTNRVRFDFPTRSSFDPFFRGGSNPRFGVLQGIYPQRYTQRGTVANSSETCSWPSSIPKDESEINVRFFRKTTRDRKVDVEVTGPTALRRVGDERDLRDDCLQRMPTLGEIAPRVTRGDDFQVSFPVARTRFRKAYTGRPKTLVLSGVARTPVSANGNRVGLTVVRTRVVMKLIGSRSR
jgi:hypothetical protein